MRIGAGVSYDTFQSTLDAEFPHLSAYWRRIGGWQVRAMGTVGGNIANGSPIGDTPPALIALGATVTLRKGAARRTLPLEEFFIAYGKQDREPGDFVEEIFVPRPAAGSLDAAYKVTKRRDEDISAVAAAFHVETDGSTVTVARARLRRHGRDPEARRCGRGRPRRPAVDARHRRPGRSRASPRTSSRSPTGAPPRTIASSSRATCSAASTWRSTGETASLTREVAV